MAYILSWSARRLRKINLVSKTRKHITTKIKADRRNLGQIGHTVFHEKKGTIILVLSLEDKGRKGNKWRLAPLTVLNFLLRSTKVQNIILFPRFGFGANILGK